MSLISKACRYQMSYDRPLTDMYRASRASKSFVQIRTGMRRVCMDHTGSFQNCSGNFLSSTSSTWIASSCQGQLKTFQLNRDYRLKHQNPTCMIHPDTGYISLHWSVRTYHVDICSTRLYPFPSKTCLLNTKHKSILPEYSDMYQHCSRRTKLGCLHQQLWNTDQHHRQYMQWRCLCC